MQRIRCCKEFESHCCDVLHEDGFRVVLVWSAKRGFLSLVEFWQQGKQPPDPCEGGVRINFCPWCGQNLEHHYTSPESLTVPKDER